MDGFLRRCSSPPTPTPYVENLLLVGGFTLSLISCSLSCSRLEWNELSVIEEATFVNMTRLETVYVTVPFFSGSHTTLDPQLLLKLG